MLRKGHWFLVFSLLIPMLLIAFVIMFNRHSAFDPLDPPDFTPTPAPSDWVTPGTGAGLYKPIEPIDERHVPIHRIILPPNQNPDFLKPTSEGGCLAVSFDQTNEKDISSQPAYIMHAIRYTKDGRISWDKRYGSEPFHGYGISMCVFPDDSFAISLRTASQTPAEPHFGDQLIRFRADGVLDWMTELDAVPAGGLEHIFARTDGAVLAAGTVDGSGLVGVSQLPRVAAYLIDGNGKVLTHYLQSGVGYQAMMEAVFDEQTGLVLLSHEEQNVESPTGAIWQRKNKITCLNESLQERWSNVYDANKVVHNILTKTKDGGLVISASIRLDQQPSTPNQPMLVAIDPEGQDKWAFRETTALWYSRAACLADGRLIVGQQKQGTGFNPDTTLAVIVDGQTDPSPVDSIQGSLVELAATKDGGFTAIVRQSVRQLPQPPYISSIWQDTAAVVTHYDSSFRLIWRRTVDQYKHGQRIDLIVTTTDDRLLAG